MAMPSHKLHPDNIIELRQQAAKATSLKLRRALLAGSQALEREYRAAETSIEMQRRLDSLVLK